MAEITKITDFEAPEFDVYARLSETQLLNRHEPEKGMFIAESPKVVMRALDAGCVPVSCMIEERELEGEAWEVIQRCGDVPVYAAPYEIIRKITGFPMTRGMLCAMYRPAPKTLDEICEGAKRIAILENVVNPTNIGAVFRSAAALNMDGILLTKGCSNPLYRRAIRVSMGTVFQIPWAFMEDGAWPEEAMGRLCEKGFKTAAMALCEDTLNIDDERLSKEDKLAIILGTEGEGLEISTIKQCDYTVKIPMSHGVDSLNVAAASAVAFWQLAGRK